MKPLFLALALAQLPLCGFSQEAKLAPVALYTEFNPQPPAAVLEALQAEVRSLMAPMGFSFQWLPLSAGDRQVSVELVVINFQGRCDISGLMPHSSVPGPLGWTHISDGVILPFADVDCAAVRTFVQRDLLLTRVEARQPLYGRALGRVLAHELYHVLADTTRHGSDGVAREFYSVQDLLASDFQFEPRECRALIQSKAHAALANALAAGYEEPDNANSNNGRL